METIAENISAQRLKHKLTQAKLADKLGVQYQTISKWETGTTVPDTMMLPKLAKVFDISIDELFGIKQIGCSKNIPNDKKEFLLHTYSQMYAPEAGPWNLSVENKYLEYRFADFFEKHFTVSENDDICNIGIGAGEWDIYLSYKLKKGTLTSIDKLEVCCKQLEQRLIYEENPHTVVVICSNVMDLNFTEKFDIVTIVGSTMAESKMGIGLFEKVVSLVKPGGALYYQSIDSEENRNTVLKTAYKNKMDLSAFLEDSSYGFNCCYFKFTKACSF